MLHRLLACFALVTGFAAVAVPVSASEVEAMSCQIGESAQQHSACAGEHQVSSSCPVNRAPNRSTGDAMARFQNDSPAYPAVLVRIDLAHE